MLKVDASVVLVAHLFVRKRQSSQLCIRQAVKTAAVRVMDPVDVLTFRTGDRAEIETAVHHLAIGSRESGAARRE